MEKRRVVITGLGTVNPLGKQHRRQLGRCQSGQMRHPAPLPSSIPPILNVSWQAR